MIFLSLTPARKTISILLYLKSYLTINRCGVSINYKILKDHRAMPKIKTKKTEGLNFVFNCLIDGKMKSLLIINLFLLVPFLSIAQQNPYWEVWQKEQGDSLLLSWNNPINDTIRMGLARSLGYYYMELNLDSSHYFLQKQAALAAKLKLKLWEADALDNIGYILSYKKDYAQSLNFFLTAINIAEDKKTEENIWQVYRFSKAGDPGLARLVVLASCHLDIGRLYGYTGNLKEELANSFKALKIAEQVADPANLGNINMNIGLIFIRINQLDSALSFQKKALAYTESSGFYKYNGNIYSYLGAIYLQKGNYPLAKEHYAKAILEGTQQNNGYALALGCIGIGNTLSLMGESDSAIWYVKKGLTISQAPDLLAQSYSSLASFYKLKGNMDSAFYYQGLAMTEKDNINNIEKIKQFENIGFDAQLKVQQLEKEKIESQNRIRTYGLLISMTVLAMIALIIFRNNHQKQKANKVLETTLDNLKSTQAQLIQSEKMASLGELTAGIAHEIQNPLNFVNNFSELNQELANELDSELAIGNTQQAKDLVTDIKTNSEKINQHGLRASSIVKGMLEHSRKSSGVKEPTDINKLCEEFIRLSYHGLRANDPQDTAHKSFNCEYKLDLDPKLPLVSVVSQDIGRVLLNVVNNAFQACKEKFESMKLESQKDYKPFVVVSTKFVASLPAGEAGHCEICISDNGPGISDSIKNKIFQPFFTTKPTGQGTGLGLSLAYDILKAHGGEIKVETKEGEATKFIIQLPVS